MRVKARELKSSGDLPEKATMAPVMMDPRERRLNDDPDGQAHQQHGHQWAV